MRHRCAAVALLAALVSTGCGEASTSTTSAPPEITTTTSMPTPGGTLMELTSTAFDNGAGIPARYTCDGDDISPPLAVTDIPDGAAALVLVMDDPDAPGGTWDHWVEFDIPVAERIAEGADVVGTPGTNSWGRIGYGGPCPPSGTHRYVFKVIAVSAPLELPEGATKQAVLEAAAAVSLGEATLLGRYSRTG